MKECGQCGAQKRVSGTDPEFYKREASDDGFQNVCKACSKLNCAEQCKRNKARRAAREAAKIKQGDGHAA